MKKKNSRIWHDGPPPHIGWWNASSIRDARAWRWWNGKHWSEVAYPLATQDKAARIARFRAKDWPIEWSLLYPKNARVPRTKP